MNDAMKVSIHLIYLALFSSPFRIKVLNHLSYSTFFYNFVLFQSIIAYFIFVEYPYTNDTFVLYYFREFSIILILTRM